MVKFLIVLASLFALISQCHALLPFSFDSLVLMPSPAPTPECGSNVTDMMECVPFFLDDQSQPDDSCCSAFESFVSINGGCTCEMIRSDNLPLDLTKAMMLPTMCWVSLPCDVHVSPAPAPSPVDAAGPNGPDNSAPSSAPVSESPALSPVDAPEPNGPENLVPSLAPESESPAPSPSVPSPNPGPSHAPYSPKPVPVPSPKPTRSSASLAAHPFSISVIVLLISIFCVYFY